LDDEVSLMVDMIVELMMMVAQDDGSMMRWYH
jgi:hypothetical protein